jgi:pimeloyl-ACP methyl ester carboxylesterase
VALLDSPARTRIRTSGRWFGPAERPLLGWLTTPEGGVGASGVVLVPPVGYEYWSSHRTLRTLAERLAEAGHAVLRYDHESTGDSSGGQWEPGRVGAWRRGVAAAAEELRALGATRIVLAGLGLGGTLALAEGATVGADAVAAWAPIVSGKRYVRELRLLTTPVEASEERPDPAGAVVYAGTVLTEETRAELGALDLLALPERPAESVLLVSRPERPADELADALERLGAAVAHRTPAGAERTLDVPAEDAVVAEQVVEEIAAWAGAAAPAGGGAPEPRASARVGPIVEEVVELGERRLVGLLGRPAGAARATVVFLNSGSEVHVGPGRAWVDYTRALNEAGYATLRLDFSGWGESPDEGRPVGRPYDAHAVGDTADAIAALRALGHERLVLAGLCAGAWIGLRTALEHEVDAVVAINPQLYWQPGDPVEALLTDTRVRRTRERRREELGGRWGLWSALDLLGLTPMAGRWLSTLRRRRVAVLLLFAEGDDGVEFLRNRVRRRLDRELRSGGIRLVEVPGVDHQMYRVWRRPAVVAAIRSFLDERF